MGWFDYVIACYWISCVFIVVDVASFGLGLGGYIDAALLLVLMLGFVFVLTCHGMRICGFGFKPCWWVYVYECACVLFGHLMVDCHF